LIILPILYYYSEKNWKVYFKKTTVGLLLMCISGIGFAQNPRVSLDEAIAIGHRNYPTIKTGRLQVEQAQKLGTIKSIQPPTNIFLSGEEFNFNESSGIHSLRIMQNFNLPKVNRSQQKVFQQQAALAQKQLELTEREIAYYISLSYYDLLYQKQIQEYAQTLVESYQEFVTINNDKFQAGEIGKLPLLTAQDQLKAVEWSLQVLEQDRQLSQKQFNNWLQTDTIFDTAINELPLPSEISNTDLQNHPRVQFYQQSEQVALAQVEVVKSKLIPQLQTGVMLQTVEGQFPFYGFQLGINVPLFRKSQNIRIEAAKIQVHVQQAQKQAVVREMEIQQDQLNIAIERQLTSIKYLGERLLPSVVKRQAFARTAFQQGEAHYLEYLKSIEQGINYQLAYLKALKEYHLLKIKLKYLIE